MTIVGVGTVPVRPDLTKFQKTTEDGVRGALSKIGSKMQSIGRSMYSTGRSATIGLTLPIVAGFKTAIDEATQFNQVQAQTEAAMKSTGSAANVTAGHVVELAAKIGELSAQDGEVVHSMENILLTFPAVRNEVGKGNQIFDRASLAVANLSARMGTDLTSAATFVGKALGNPIKGLTALTRVGVEFDDEQITLIKRMVRHGHVMEAQKVILKELTKEFGGSAKAMGDAASPLTKLSLAFKDLAQEVGPILIKMVEALTTKLKAVFAWFEKLSPSVQHNVVMVGALVAAMGPLLIILGSAVRLFGLLFNVVTGGIGLFARLGGAAAAATPAIEGAAAGATGLGAAASVAAPLVGLLAVAVAAVALESNKMALDKVKDSVETFGASSRKASHDLNSLGVTAGSVRGIGVAYSNTLREGTEQQRKWFESINGNLKALGDYNNVMHDAEGITKAQAVSIAVLINGYEGLHGRLSKSQQMFIRNLLAVGDYTGALKLLKGWIDKIPSHRTILFAFPGLDAGIAKMQAFNRELVKAGVQLQVNQAGQLHGFGGRKAAGGPVMGGMTYLVGERGPEWFTPKSSGAITPNAGGGPLIGTVNNYRIQSDEEVGRVLERSLRRARMLSGLSGG